MRKLAIIPVVFSICLSSFATPVIIIMPDANTGRRGYYNDIKGDFQYEDFFFKELMPEAEKKFRIRDEKTYRAVAGFSMVYWREALPEVLKFVSMGFHQF